MAKANPRPRARPPNPPRPIPWASPRLIPALLESVEKSARHWDDAVVFAGARPDWDRILAVARILRATLLAVKAGDDRTLTKMALPAAAQLMKSDDDVAHGRSTKKETDQLDTVTKITGDYFRAFQRGRVAADDVADAFLGQIFLFNTPWARKLHAHGIPSRLGALDRLKPRLEKQVRAAFTSELKQLAREIDPPDVDLGERLVRRGLEALGYPHFRDVFSYRLKREKRRTDTS